MLAQTKHTWLLAFLLFCSALAARAEDITYTRFTVDLGEVVAAGNGLTVRATEQGRILLRVPATDMTLDPNQHLRFRFGAQPPVETYLLWRTGQANQLLQKRIATAGNASPIVDLGTVAGWEGELEQLQFGFLVAPGAELTVHDIRLVTPQWHDRAADTLANWLAFRPWIARDINVYTGTRDFHVGPYPVPVVAGATLLLIALYVLLRRRQARWSIIGLTIFCGWLVLDGLWQWRLWQQLELTRERYAGLSSERKPLVSEDAMIARFVSRARAEIAPSDARVFVASMSDSNGMRAAYYLSPLNTYWHRRGTEVPEKGYLRPGDYILVVGGSRLLYNRGAGLIRLSSGEEVAVRERFADNTGLLLEVKE